MLHCSGAVGFESRKEIKFKVTDGLCYSRKTSLFQIELRIFTNKLYEAINWTWLNWISVKEPEPYSLIGKYTSLKLEKLLKRIFKLYYRGVLRIIICVSKLKSHQCWDIDWINDRVCPLILYWIKRLQSQCIIQEGDLDNRKLIQSYLK